MPCTALAFAFAIAPFNEYVYLKSAYSSDKSLPIHTISFMSAILKKSTTHVFKYSLTSSQFKILVLK